MTFNIALQTDVLVQIELAREGKNPLSRWDQGDWAKVYAQFSDVTDENGDIIIDEETGLPIGVGSCGSAMCNAGWALSLAKVPLLWEWDDNDEDALLATGCTVDGSHRQVMPVAVDLLGYPSSVDRPDLWGYTKYSAYLPTLFDTENTIDDLYRITAEVAEVNEVELRATVAGRVRQILEAKA